MLFPFYPKNPKSLVSPSPGQQYCSHYNFQFTCLNKVKAQLVLHYIHLALRHLGFVQTGNSAIRSANLKIPQKPDPSNGSDIPVWRYGHLKFSQIRGRSVVGRSPVGRSSIYILTLMSYTPLLYVRNAARED